MGGAWDGLAGEESLGARDSWQVRRGWGGAWDGLAGEERLGGAWDGLAGEERLGGAWDSWQVRRGWGGAWDRWQVRRGWGEHGMGWQVRRGWGGAWDSWQKVMSVLEVFNWVGETSLQLSVFQSTHQCCVGAAFKHASFPGPHTSRCRHCVLYMYVVCRLMAGYAL